ncbi:unnamed protein product [Toxocara canis]|uniref:AAA_5 domain-containing protein n=1 Tax=Toxocara canis TaxID=6265 RepID=A0A183U312_TOXCA|nr:unnamed protein product [Toxocara canis]
MPKHLKNRKRKGNVTASVGESLRDEKKKKNGEPMEAREEGHVEFDCIPTRSALREQIETGMKSHCLVVVEGPIGCGKTCIVRQIASTMKISLCVFQMGDQIDSKTLYGAFHCAEVPGEFVWKPSIFTKVIRKPGVVLLEDLDCASVDLISSVIDLCERRWVRMNAGEVIRMHPQAFVVATLRTSNSGRTSVAADARTLLSSIPLHVVLPPFSDEELRRIICVKYGRVAAVARKLIAVFNEVVAANMSRRQNSKRMLTSTLV